jgi:flagellar basal-body rod protein FlgB
MFVERLLNQGPSPVLEQFLRFTDARQSLLSENIANLSTPGYIQKDLSLPAFQAKLRERLDERDSAPPDSTSFDDISIDVDQPKSNILFHDGNNRSVEQLMSDNAKNALMHSLAVELLKRQFATMEMALREKP